MGTANKRITQKESLKGRLKNLATNINSILAYVPILYSLKTPKHRKFLVLSGVINENIT